VTSDENVKSLKLNRTWILSSRKLGKWGYRMV